MCLFPTRYFRTSTLQETAGGFRFALKNNLLLKKQHFCHKTGIRRLAD